MNEHPRIIGRAAYGLSGDVSWAVNRGAAQFGADAELKTANMLNKHALREDGPTVFHDVRIPIPGFTANLDHIVVAGTTVLIIDTKAWKTGFMWTVAGKTFRGFTPFPACDKHTVEMGASHIKALLDRAGARATMAPPLIVVWPTGGARPTTWAARFPGARIVTPARLDRAVGRMHGAADSRIQTALVSLVNSRQSRQPAWRRAS